MADRFNPQALTALTLLVAESKPDNKDLMLRLNGNLMMVHQADDQDRDGALEVVMQLLAPTISKLNADGGYAGPKLRKEIREQGLPDILEIVGKPKDTKGFTVLPRRWVVERTFALDGPMPSLVEGLRAPH